VRGFQIYLSSHRVSITTLTLTSLFFVYDIIHDVFYEHLSLHFYLEIIIFILILLRLTNELSAASRLVNELEDEKTRNSNLSGQLSRYISERFDTWRLSQSEKDISWLMLKGYTFKEIAQQRDVKEKTIRQQASSIYKKSSCKNRNEFNAHFFENIIDGITTSGQA
jgi:DNA-binding CsgD family transcriptional regulator